jgi:hypothetical protein
MVSGIATGKQEPTKMASSANAALCGVVAAIFWTGLGFAVARLLLPRVLAIGTAPVVGWAIHSALALPILTLTGFSTISVVSFAILAAIGSGFLLLVGGGKDESIESIPAWALLAAAFLALAPAAAIAPKISADAVQLSSPIFDHSKIALIDSIARLGLPPVNPFFGEFGEAGRPAYYFLWYFSAAELRLALDVSGWEADIGLTWFSAFSSLTLMMGLAVWLGARSSAAAWVLVLSTAGSLRAALSVLFSDEQLYTWLAPPIGLAGWLFQTAWTPQHMMSASCVVLAILLMARYAVQRSRALLLMLAVTVVAGFESSAYVGGVTFAIAAVVGGLLLLAKVEPAQRLRVALGLAAAAVLAVCLALPVLRDQLAGVAAREGGALVVVRNLSVFADGVPESIRRALDLPGYWLVLLPIEFPAIYVAGLMALLAWLWQPGPDANKRFALIAIAALIGASLAISWLLVSTIGDINDLALRATLPGMICLIACAAAGTAVGLSRRAFTVAAFAIAGLVLSLPEAVGMVHYYVRGNSVAEARPFAKTPELWAAVRRHAKPNERVANNPLFLQRMTPWPVNISWALLADRSSCFAGRELALAFAPLPRQRREAVNEQFVRIFEGKGTAEDVVEMTTRYACQVVVVTADDGAWGNDPFSAAANYTLVESREGRWRIYRARAAAAKP